MNFDLKNIPERTSKPRQSGITMVIDKGSSIQECKNLIESSSKYIDFVKFGWTTSKFLGMVTNLTLKEGSVKQNTSVDSTLT